MRLIDKDAMIADLVTVDPQFKTMIDWCIRVTEAQPTVDAVPVRHGKWKLIRMEDNGDGFYTCSNCDRGDIHSPLVTVPYCWYCGARMDADAE